MMRWVVTRLAMEKRVRIEVARTFYLVFPCNDPERILGFVDDNPGDADKGRVFALSNLRAP